MCIIISEGSSNAAIKKIKLPVLKRTGSCKNSTYAFQKELLFGSPMKILHPIT
jgi:hypothetical protein